MRKLLLSSIVLFLFSASILIFQVSCKKEVNADIPSVAQCDDSKQLCKILYEGEDKFWLMNYDGTDKQKLNIPLPSGETAIESVKLSPDGQRIFFVTVQELKGATSYPYEYFHLYSCKLDGSDVKKILDSEDKLEPRNFYIY